MFVIPPWMNLLMTQQHLPQESAAPGSPAAPPRCRSGPPLVSAGGSWHQRGAGFPSLKAPQTPHVRPDTHSKIVLLRFQCFFLYEVPCSTPPYHRNQTAQSKHRYMYTQAHTLQKNRKHTTLLHNSLTHSFKRGASEPVCAWKKTDNVPSRSLWLKATPEWGCTAPHPIRTAWNHQGQQMSKK